MIVGSSDVTSKQIPFVTMILILVNICMFTKSYFVEVQAARESQQNLMVYYQDAPIAAEKNEELEAFFDKYGFQWSDLAERDLASLITHMFVHVGMMHIIGNMLALWAFAVALEEILGAGVFTGLYFLSGLAACLAQGLCDVNSTIPMVGASGAVAGVLGAYIVACGHNATVKFLVFFYGFHIIKIPAPIFAIFWLISQLAAIAEGGFSGGGVAIMAHLAGFAVGGAIAYFMKSEYEHRVDSDTNGELVIGSAIQKGPSEAELLEQVLECQPFSQVVETIGRCDIGCPKCGTTLDLHNPVGDRLVRCSNHQCSHMTYVDGNLLAAHV